MYNGIGLRTVRGSATSGHVTANRAHVRASSVRAVVSGNTGANQQDWGSAPKQVKANAEILEHKRKREIEAKLFELTEEMEEQGYSQSEIDDRVGAARKKLENGGGSRGRGGGRDTHDQAQRKEHEMKRLAKTFGIDADRHQSGESFDPEMQEQRKRERKEAWEAKVREYACADASPP